MEKYLKVGVITSAHGVRGEVKVYPTTDDPERFLDLDSVILEKNGKREEHDITGVKFFKNLVILKLAGIESMNDAEKYRQWDLIIPREKGVPLEEGEYYQADLIDMEVFLENGSFFGTLRDIIETGANDVYAVETEQYGEVLIPNIKPCIISVDIEACRMVVHLLPGLADLNRK